MFRAWSRHPAFEIGAVNEMEYRSLGQTGLNVSCIGLGGMGFMDGRTVDRRTGVAIIRTALDQGINFFDTARIYFESEDVFGEALAGETRPA